MRRSDGLQPLRRSGLKPDDRVGVVGLGGLEHMGALYARAMSGRVAVISSTADKEAQARELGAELFIPTKTRAPVEALQAWDGGANLILATANSMESVNALFPGLAPNGTLVVLGVGLGDVSLSPMVLWSCANRFDSRPIMECVHTRRGTPSKGPPRRSA